MSGQKEPGFAKSMMHPTYDDTLTLEEARRAFFLASGLGESGGYDERWVRIETKPWPIYFPNTRSRVAAARLHDLHHVATEYAADWPGEAQIAAFELAAGCGRHYWAWFLNLGAMIVGLMLFPKRTISAFRRGRHAKSLYHSGFREQDLACVTVGMLRQSLNIEPVRKD